ncbi:MAG: hypothetical protein BGO69_04765 [Bacteroidetes bacterium 46-16]|nr:MAG: hypothetical protein BGO69_04765 [Bacteroidetes bacterium 46-16]
MKRKIISVVFALILYSCTPNNKRFEGSYYGASNCSAKAGNLVVEANRNEQNRIVFHDPDIGKIQAIVDGDSIYIPYQIYYLKGHKLTTQGTGRRTGNAISIRTFSQDLITMEADSCFFYGNKPE